MSETATGKIYTILIDGDVVVDHHIYLGSCDRPTEPGEGTQIISEQGGAGLTASLLAYLCAEEETNLRAYAAKPPLSEDSASSPYGAPCLRHMDAFCTEEGGQRC